MLLATQPPLLIKHPIAFNAQKQMKNPKKCVYVSKKQRFPNVCIKGVTKIKTTLFFPLENV